MVISQFAGCRGTFAPAPGSRGKEVQGRPYLRAAKESMWVLDGLIQVEQKLQIITVNESRRSLLMFGREDGGGFVSHLAAVKLGEAVLGGTSVGSRPHLPAEY